MKCDNLKIYTDSVEKLIEEKTFREYYNSVSPDRQEKIDRLRQIKDKRLSLAAGLLLRTALNEAGYDENHLTPALLEKGKPFYKEIKDTFQFSISHSEEMVMIAVNYGPEAVGCDIERIKEINLNIADRHFTSGEAQLISEGKTHEEKLELFYRIWTLKESFMKATGLGFSLPLNEFEIVFDGEKASVRQTADSDEYCFESFRINENYIGAVCKKTDNR